MGDLSFGVLSPTGCRDPHGVSLGWVLSLRNRTLSLSRWPLPTAVSDTPGGADGVTRGLGKRLAHLRLLLLASHVLTVPSLFWQPLGTSGEAVSASET